MGLTALATALLVCTLMGIVISYPLMIVQRFAKPHLISADSKKSTAEIDSTNSEENEVAPNLEELREDLLIKNIELQMQIDPKASMTVPQLLRSYGYGVEVHHVTTEDGYILELHRVLTKPSHSCSKPGKQRTKGRGCQPVLLQHGLLGSSSAWVMNEPSKALAYILADRGHDVWLGNSRGNIYSMNHTSLSVCSSQFWDFSFHEMGKFDLPSVIEYILSTTKHEKLHYVGHSMGTTMYWVMEHEHPGYSTGRVASMVGLGPVAFVEHAKSPIVLLAPFNREIGWVMTRILHEYRFLNPNFILTKLTEKACSLFKLAELVCSNAVFLLIGFDSRDLDLNWLPMILGQLNAGTSTKTLIHFAQLIESEKFQKFDYRSDNHVHYNQSHAPTYDLARVTTPLLLKWGRNDWLADPTDVQQLLKGLTNTTVSSSAVDNPNFNHLDFLWGKDARRLVYEDVSRFLEQNSP